MDIKDINNTPDTTAEFDPKDIADNKVMAVLAYLSWLVLIPLLAAPKSKYARFHTNQGLVLAIAEIIWSIVFSIVSGIVAGILPFLGAIFSLIGSLVGLVFLIFSILGIVNAAQGKAKEVPIVGKFKLLK